MPSDNPPSPDAKGSDMVPALDFDMYNYLCLVLLEGRGVPEIGDVPFDTLVEINQNELQQNSELIASSLANPHTLDVPVRRRLFLYDAYRTNERIEHILEQALPDEDLPPHTAFSKYSDLALKYQRLSDLIEDTMVTPQDREPKDYATMVVDLRTLVLSLTKVFVTRLHAGLLKDGRYTSYGKAAAKAMAAPLFELGDEQRDGISTRSGSQLQRLLTARKQKIFGGIAEGEVENYLDDGLDLVIRVNRFLALVFQNVNKESSPILATAYKIEQMKQASDHYNMAVADPLGEGNTSPYHRPSTKRKNDDGTPFKPTRTKRMWTDEETEILKQGLVAYGHNWKQITIDFPQLQRTPVQLKDRARNVRNILMASGQELGVWQPPVKNQQ